MPPKPSCECGSCAKCRGREWARRNRDKHVAYVQQNRDKILAYKAAWRIENLERVREKSRIYSRTRGNRYREQPAEKTSARRAVSHALRDGRLTRATACETCGAAPIYHDGRSGVQAHHDDYSKPLEVRWLCGSCHAIEHRKVA